MSSTRDLHLSEEEQRLKDKLDQMMMKKEEESEEEDYIKMFLTST